jgi:large subunit ribosomal protein L9
MQVILLERVEKLGQMGDEVRVKDGFARNFLLPKKKALRATKANREYFQTQKVKLEAHNLDRKKDADAIARKLDGKSFMLIRQAGDRGQLYGSVTPRDVATVMEAGGFKVDRHQVQISQAIKTIGLFVLPVVLHPEVKVNITINVARSEDEALRQARGENVLAGRTEQEEAVIAAEELFEEGAGPTAEDGDATEEEPAEA